MNTQDVMGKNTFIYIILANLDNQPYLFELQQTGAEAAAALAEPEHMAGFMLKWMVLRDVCPIWIIYLPYCWNYHMVYGELGRQKLAHNASWYM